MDHLQNIQTCIYSIYSEMPCARIFTAQISARCKWSEIFSIFTTYIHPISIFVARLSSSLCHQGKPEGRGIVRCEIVVSVVSSSPFKCVRERSRSKEACIDCLTHRGIHRDFFVTTRKSALLVDYPSSPERDLIVQSHVSSRVSRLSVIRRVQYDSFS